MPGSAFTISAGETFHCTLDKPMLSSNVVHKNARTPTWIVGGLDPNADSKLEFL
jgi:hypothetical protein